MNIVKFKNGNYAVRKWCVVYLYADADNFERWGWWFGGDKRHSYMKSKDEAKELFANIIAAKGKGEVIDT
tara:strand:+ start:222 stop:431 length:210 start_codon:yes stop_codon:yes gene_type:complete